MVSLTPPGDPDPGNQESGNSGSGNSFRDNFRSDASDLAAVYNRYLDLSLLAQQDFPGTGIPGTLESRLLVVPVLRRPAAQWVFAASIASAASLAIESDPERIRHANRQRISDFTVNTLSEAIRILKNQIRKREAVSVCLSGSLAPVLEEIVDRGLQPDLVLLPVSGDEGGGDAPDLRSHSLMNLLIARGARAVGQSRLQLRPEGKGSGRGEAGSASPENDSVLVEARWRVAEAPGLWLPKIDTLFEECFPGDPRCRWVQRSPFYFPRILQFERFVRLTVDESERWTALLAASRRSGRIPAAIQFAMGGGFKEIV